MHRKTLSPVLVALLIVALTILPASAITDGRPDGQDHPYVGVMEAKDSQDITLWTCSGTLLSPTLFLTAGHCVQAPAARFNLWFYTDMQEALTAGNGNLAPQAHGTPYTHPGYDPADFALHDLAVVVLDTPMERSAYGALPTLNQLDELARPSNKQDITFTTVGYGLQRSFPQAAGWKISLVLQRMVAEPKLIQINGGSVGYDSLLVSNNAKTGGTCFGDSGGPNFIGNTNVLAGITSYGRNDPCGGTSGVYRVDRADDLDWIYGTFGDLLP